MVPALGGTILVAALCWTGCGSSGDECQPLAELCNGLDDDCDGLTDEGFPVDASCTSGVGACLAAGVFRCAEDGSSATCDAVPGEPSAETCNQIDEDCDGQTDEEVASCCQPATEQACGTDQGACTAGVQTCSASGAWETCLAGGVPAVLPGDLEESCNGIDDDCDGVTDEDLTAPACALQLGVCSGSVHACAGSEGWTCGAAQYGANYQPGEMTCDGLDNDCDGQTDEGFSVGATCSAGTGACARAGVTLCRPGGTGAECDAVAGEPSSETCNGVDDDCDGQSDEELSSPLCANQQGVCQGARMACGGAGGWEACGASRYGPAYEAVEASCDDLDNDCDGSTDEGVQTTYFRDADGDTYGNGSVTTLACSVPVGYETRGLDCDDTRELAHPGAGEMCGNGMDDDCDGITDAPSCP